MSARFVASLLVVALLGGACSSSDDDATPSTAGGATTPVTTTPVTTTPVTTVPVTTVPANTSVPATSTTPPSTAAPATAAPAASGPTTVPDGFTDAETTDRDTARTALITLAAFPDGWVEDPVEDESDDPDTESFEAEFDACLGREDESRVGDDLDRLKVRTGDFHPPDDRTTTVSHEVVLAPDPETALAAMNEVRIDGAEPCLADVIGDFYRSAFASDPDLAEVGIGDVIVTRTEQGGAPDEAVGVLLEVPLTIGDETVSQFLELLYQRRGRALSELSFGSFGTGFDRARHAALSDEVAVRLATIGG